MVILLTYWICVTTEENWRIIREKNIWGVPPRSKKIIENVKEGDKLIFYVIQSKKDNEIIPPKIVAIYEASSKAFYDNKPLFKSYKGKIFPYRIKIKPIKIAKKPINFKEFVDRLSFIKNKKFWTAYFRRAMFEIPSMDFEILMKAIR